MLVGPEAQPPSRPPWLGGGGPPQVTAQVPSSQSTLRTSRSRSFDVFEPRAPEEPKDNGGRHSACAIAWMGDGVTPGPPAPTRPRSAAPSPRRAPSLHYNSSSAGEEVHFVSAGDHASQYHSNSVLSHVEEGPPGKLPLGERLRQQPLACTSYPSVVAGAPRAAAYTLSSSIPRKAGHCDEGNHADPSCDGTQGFPLVQFPSSPPRSEEGCIVQLAQVPSSASSRPFYACSSTATVRNDTPRNQVFLTAPVSSEEAALAAGALAELRASVASAVGKLHSLELGFMEEARQRQELSRAFSQHKRKQTEAIGANSAWSEKASARMDQLTLDWNSKQTQVDSHILSLEQLCRHLQESGQSMVERVDSASEECAQHHVRLEALESSIFEFSDGRRGLDSRIGGLERTVSDLQVQLGATSERIMAMFQTLPKNEDLDNMRVHVCRLEESMQKQSGAASVCESEVDDLKNKQFEIMEKMLQLEKGNADVNLLVRDLDSRLDARILQFEARGVELPRRVEESDRRLKELETLHSNLTEKLRHDSAQQSKHSKDFALSWEVEEKFRNIAEEVSAVAERSMATYVEAARAELLQHIDSLSKRWSNSTRNEFSLEAFDTLEFSQTEVGSGSVQVNLTEDFQDSEWKKLGVEDVYPQSSPMSTSMRTQRLDVFDTCAEQELGEHALEKAIHRKCRWPLRQASEATEQEQLGRPPQHGSPTLRRSVSESKASSVVSPSHASTPVWRPLGSVTQALKSPSSSEVHAHRSQKAPNTARRLRSASPTQMRERFSTIGPVMRPPSLPRSFEGFSS